MDLEHKLTVAKEELEKTALDKVICLRFLFKFRSDCQSRFRGLATY